MFNICLYEIYEKIVQLSSIINHNYSLMIDNDNASFHFSSRKNHVLAIFILNYKHILIYLSKCQIFESNRIHKNPFFEIQKFWLNCPLILSKKILKTTKRLNINAKQIRSTYRITSISSIIIGLLLIIIANFKNLFELKQHIITTINKFPKNSSKVPLLWLNGNGIIWDVGLGCESESIDQGRSYIDKNINISLCFFARYSKISGDGGIIRVYGGSYSMNINYSMFYNCVSSSAGAIYFSSSNSYLRMICANRCSCDAQASYHFAYIFVSLVNQVEYLSVSNCSHTSSGYTSFCLRFGNQRVDNTNSSMNNAIKTSGIWIYLPSSFTSIHCTFSNNMISSRICIYLYSDSGTVSMSYANIVHNNSPYDGVVFIQGEGSKKMMYCIFKNNQNYLFCVWLGSLEVSHSFFDHSESFSTSTAVSISNNNSFTNTITYQIPFFNSLHCSTDSPERTPDLSPTPKCTFKETPMNTLENTLLNTPNESPYNTHEESPLRSLEETIRRTNEETLRMTYERTIDQTNRETQKETIPRTYVELLCTNQMAKKREINMVFSFAFVYSVMILMIS